MKSRLALFLTAAALVGSAAAQSPHTHRHSFGDAEKWAHVFDDPERDAWQKPHAVIQALALKPDSVVADLGAGTGYFTTLIARRADTVLAVEPVPDMQRVLRERCVREGVGNVTVIGGSALELGSAVPDGTVDSAVLVSCLHHLHRRPEVYASLARAVRPGGRLYLVEPHHNVRRVARLFWKWCTRYRRPAFWRQERHWATHDFLTTREIRRLCADAGFERVAVSGYWIPFTRRFVADPRRRFALETRLGRLPGVRHMAAVLAVEARRR